LIKFFTPPSPIGMVLKGAYECSYRVTKKMLHIVRQWKFVLILSSYIL